MAIGRITGPLLKANLLRDGVNLAFETDLLFLDVQNGRIGIRTASPTHDLTVNGTTRTTYLQVPVQAEIGVDNTKFTITGNTISSTNSTINLEPSGTNAVVYQGKIVTGDLAISTNIIEVTAPNTDLEIKTLGTGKVNVNADMYVTGDVHVTGNIVANGDIQIGDANTDNIVFNADINSNLIPDDNNTWDLGSDPNAGGKAWRHAYIHEIDTSNIAVDHLEVNGITLETTQGNIIYVAKNGSDSNAGLHENNPVATVKHALSLADSNDTVFIYPGTYEEQFPLTVPAGVTVKGSGLRAVKIVPTTGTRYNDCFLLNGETTIEDLTVADFFSGGNYFTVTAASAGSTTVNVGTAPFAHSYVSGGTIKIGSTNYSITNAVYTHTTGVLVLTHSGGTASLGNSVFVSNLTFSCNGSTRVFPDNGYAFRFADNFTVTTKSPYVRNCSTITRGSVTSVSDPYGFDAGDAGKGAYIDGAYANSASKEASMLFHSVTFITPGVDCITAKNGVRIEWLNSFTYFANRGIYAFASNYGFARQGLTRLRIESKTGTWNVGNTLNYYDTDGVTVLGTGTIASIDGNYVNLTGRCLGFQTITDRVAKVVYANGNAKLSTANKKWGTASLVLDGTGDFATVASHPDFNFGTSDFTIECWIYRTANGVAQTIFDLRSGAADALGINLGINASNNLYYHTGATPRITGTTTVPVNTWTHIAVSRYAGVTKLFLDGGQEGSSFTDGINYPQRALRIGVNYSALEGVTGYLDDVRITKGVSRYTSGFSLPTGAFTGDNSTVLLLHFNGANNSTAFVDDGVTLQDLRTSAGGRASVINFADYSDFGAEIRSIGSANIYGNYGTYGDGDGVIAYLISQNYAYIGAGKKTTNDPLDRIAANEVVELNNAHIYYTSVDNEGNFSVGESFYVNQKTGDVLFNGEALSVQTLTGITFTDGTHSTIVTPSDITTGNIRISGNTVESLAGDVNIVAASGAINLQSNTYITGNLDVTGDITIGGNIQLGNQTTDTINFVGGISSDLIPAGSATYDLGSSGLRWANIYLSRAEIDGLVIDNNQIATTLGNDDLTLTANGTGKINIPSNNVQIDQSLTVGQDLTVTSGTTYLKGTSVTGTITQTGDYNQTGNFTTSGNTHVTGNIVGTGYLQLPQITISGNSIATTTTNTDLQLNANGSGNVLVEDFRISDNTIRSLSTNSSITLTPQGTGSVVVSSNQSIVIPVGTTAERPGTPSVGMIRYNTDLARYEGWNGSYWITLGGVQDVDGNTKITAELTPGANDNIIRFYANGSLIATIDSTKLFAEAFQTNNLDIRDNTISSINTNSDINIATSGTGGVRMGNLKITSNTITNVVNNGVTQFVQSGNGYVKIAGTNGVVIPAGDTENDRPPAPVTGMMRFNTTEQLVEVFNGTIWTGVAGTTNVGITASQATEIGIETVLILG